ncbi:Mitochondrial fission 1 protein [Fragariocoptes setiger]|uniref:Mitochondrial fission 1 protein n=1 Tax=Fragariocoptes setiger TaxID=1670756 RepID=A0ABQ7S5P1_9ACAR|nr:Mitochondrial fission 1 protein [Fragariocoptes setiger]
MEAILDDILSDSEIEKFKKAYERSLESEDESEQQQAKFHYAYALIRSSNSSVIKKGIEVLVDLYDGGSNVERRDYLYYIAVGQTRLKEYSLALDCVDKFLAVEPNNHQAQQLKAFINERLKKEGLLGMAIASGAVLAIGGLIGLGMALSKK